MVARARGVPFRLTPGLSGMAMWPCSHRKAWASLIDVARWLRYRSGLKYADDCMSNPAEVRRRLKAAR